MSFSDNNLKRLKEEIPTARYGFDDMDFTVSQLQALLDRLDAAEYALARYAVIHPEDLTSGIRDAVDAWRKSKNEF